jgi:O-acetyl-ADP-ribose deacetylase (regulator of RNase III)
VPLKIVRNDIIKMPVDAIVNAANSALKMGGGVCGAIFSAAGIDKLQEECDAIGQCNVGKAVMTKGYDLPAKYIIHTVGPVWQGGRNDEAQLLSDCYLNSLMLALDRNLKSIAFPLIASGIFGYPKDEALNIAISSIGKFLLQHDMMVYLVVYDKKAFVLSEKLFNSIEKYIDDHYVEEHNFNRCRREIETFEHYQLHDEIVDITECKAQSYAEERSISIKRSLEDVVAQLDESFAQMLLRLIDEKGFTDVETYKKANIDRKLFSKIRSDKNYNPSKTTAIAFAIALELNLDETKDLLSKAGYTLSHSNKFDVIIEYFIEDFNYNIFEINEALFAFDQSLLG